MAPRHRIARSLWSAAACAMFLLAVRAFVGDVRRVESGSMEPALAQGEWVFVRYDASPPARGELVVARPQASARPVVKRVAGLPGESVRLVQGDLLVSGMQPADAPQVWVVVEDSALEPVESRWRCDASWTRDPGGLRGDERSTPLDLLAIDDGWLRSDGTRTAGPDAAADARLDAHMGWSTTQATLVLALHSRGDIFEAHIARDGARIEARITRASLALPGPAEGAERAELAHALLEAPAADQTWSLRLGNGRVSLLLDESSVCAASSGAPRRHHADLLQEGRSYPPRASLRFAAGAGVLARLVVQRGLEWQPAGAHAVERALDLGPDQCFLLGDASFQSRDGREWGPTRLSDLVGRPCAVVWPPSGWRWLP